VPRDGDESKKKKTVTSQKELTFYLWLERFRLVFIETCLEKLNLELEMKPEGCRHTSKCIENRGRGFKFGYLK